MNKLIITTLCAAMAVMTPIEVFATASTSPTEGVITHDFVSEDDMKQDLMQMLADFSKYMTNNVQEISGTNSEGHAMISFKGENTLGNNEQGVRHNADMSMICAFLVKYAKNKVILPDGVTWNQLEDFAKKSLVYSYSTHKANKLYACKGNNYWGSTSKNDNQWESSLWAMSVAYSAFFQWESLTQSQRDHIRDLLVAECNYELERSIPTGYAGDTKAEENGWEADVLAAALGLFPDHDNAPKWFARLREFAINSYSHPSDAENTTIVDPDYDNTTIADLYLGQNLYEDYTLQNHNLFHTSYQNVVMQELGEAALALKLFQIGIHGTEKWKTNALMHNNQKVMDEVLNWLALSDGELAMPNGNDWSLFLFDQITSYSTMACFLRDRNALFLENMAYKYIKARQTTTSDGSWLLRADVGGRRMGVEGHRVMMSCLMHMILSTDDLTPTTWGEFMDNYGTTKFFPCQNVIRSSSADRFTTFSWSSGLKSYTGYIASQNPDNNKIIVPFRANNTGNFLGWYNVNGKSTDATPVVSGIFENDEESYAMNGELNVNGATLNNRFAIYSTPGNAVIYLDLVRATADATITREAGGMMAISVDEFTKLSRTFYSAANLDGIELDGVDMATFTSDWANIDNELGFVALGNKEMAFGERANNNSIMTAKFIPLYSANRRAVAMGDMVDARSVIYYTSVDAATTKALRDKAVSFATTLPEGWNGIAAADPDGAYYLLLSNFASMEKATITDFSVDAGAPVFSVVTTINNSKATAEFVEQLNASHADAIYIFIKGDGLTAIQDADDARKAYIRNNNTAASTATVSIISDGKAVSSEISIPADATIAVRVDSGNIVTEDAEMPLVGNSSLTDGYTEITDNYFANTGFEDDSTYGTVGTASLGTTKYANCYINDVDPVQSSVANILPVIGWKNESGEMQSTNGNTPYRRLYSMPYSTLMPCVSVLGNYAASCAPLIGDDRTGKRCLTVLNSWASGTNRITQTSTLGAGEYRLLIDAKYECPNQIANDGYTIASSNGNVNTSYTGVSIGNSNYFRYPSTPGVWETLVYDFNLDADSQVTLSLGYNSSTQTGAANQSLLYLDNVRLYRKGDSGVAQVIADENSLRTYSLSGIEVDKPSRGIYIRNGKKVFLQ